jgi:hypothetical protein
MAGGASETSDMRSDIDYEESVDAVLALCDDDSRAALRTLIIANDFLHAEVGRLQALISNGYTRGAVEKKKRAQ